MSTRSELIDHRARKELKNNLDQSFLVEASAGTGKTTVLVHRLVALLQSGRTTVDRVVAVTYTRKAAGELKLRLRQELEKARQNASKTSIRKNVEAAIASLEEARIGTIHSFCAEILRERPVEASVDPDFQELSSEEEGHLFNQVFKRWFEEKLIEMPEVLSRALEKVRANKQSQDPPLESLCKEARSLAQWRDYPQSWETRFFNRKQKISDIVAESIKLAQASEQCPEHEDALRSDLKPLRRFVDDLKRSLSVKPTGALASKDYDNLEAKLSNKLLVNLKKKIRKGSGEFSESMSRQEALEKRDQLVKMLEDFKQNSEAHLAASLRLLLESAVNKFEEVKKQMGKVDFVDLLLMVRNVLRDYTEVRKHLNARFTHIFVDEFQDTDPLQVEILLLLSASNVNENNWRCVRITKGKLFIVGDPKQSIYRFRRADVKLYEDVKRRLREAGVQLLHLETNFRSVEPLQRAINASFEGVFDGNVVTSQPQHVPLQFPSGSQSPTPLTRKDKTPPELIALPVPEPEIYRGELTHKSFHKSFPTAAASFVDWILNKQPWELTHPERPSEKIPIEARHITFLFRRYTNWKEDVTRPYVRALDILRIPHVLVASKTLHHREEVANLRAILKAVEWPDDELNVFATLRGPFFAVQDSLLLEYRKIIGKLHPFQEVSAKAKKEFPRIVEVLELLAELHYHRNHRPIVETLNKILEFCRAHIGLALRPTGQQILANVQRIYDLARGFEFNGGLSFRGFVEFLEEESNRSNSKEPTVLEEAADGVRLMTLHAAKGLESPIVVLMDVTCRISQKPRQYVDHERGLCALQLLDCKPWELVDNLELEQGKDNAEGQRVAYVAATRAREMLVVPALGIGPKYYSKGWISALNPAVYPAPESWYNPDPSPDGCPKFGDRTVVIPPLNRDGTPLDMIKPGLHRPLKGDHRVLWWDPNVLQIDSTPDLGLREEEILIYDESGSAKGLQCYQSWKTHREKIVQAGSKESLSIIHPSEAQFPSPKQYNVKVRKIETLCLSSLWKRFCVLVHTLLRVLPFLSSLYELNDLAYFHARVMRATERETKVSVRVVHQVLKNQLVKKAASADHCLREFPITHRLEGNKLIEGSIDLAFSDSESWTLIDFKTSSDFDEHRTEYLNQIQWYALALEEVVKAEIRPYLLWIQ